MTYILNPVMQHGWMCPNCKTAHSPSIMTCPISQTVRLTGTDTGTPYPGVTIRATTAQRGA
jgi:hypothetical protein